MLRFAVKERLISASPFAEIDPYGDTIFNKLQIPALLNELDVVLGETDNRDEQQWLLDLRALAERCRDATHLYLKLLGD